MEISMGKRLGNGSINGRDYDGPETKGKCGIFQLFG
jgi:hypothetical protein